MRHGVGLAPALAARRLRIISDKCDDIADRFIPTNGHVKGWLREMGRELRQIADMVESYEEISETH